MCVHEKETHPCQHNLCWDKSVQTILCVGVITLLRGTHHFKQQ